MQVLSIPQAETVLLKDWVDRYNTLLVGGWANVEPDTLFCHVAQLIEDMAARLGRGPDRDMLLLRRAMMHGHAGAPDAVMVADHLAFVHGVLARRLVH